MSTTAASIWQAIECVSGCLWRQTPIVYFLSGSFQGLRTILLSRVWVAQKSQASASFGLGQGAADLHEH